MAKKCISMILAAILTAAAVSACGSNPEKTETTTAMTEETTKDAAKDTAKAPEAGGNLSELQKRIGEIPEQEVGTEAIAIEDAFENVTPLESEVPLSIGALSSSTHGFTNILIQKLGGYEKANIEADIAVFDSGPIMVEAMASQASDCGAYGLGGTLAGTIGQGFVNLGCASRDYHALQFFAPNDSPIVKAGCVTDGYPLLYGTADTWKGAEIYLPMGTTLHYLLSKGLEKLGLTTEDVTLIHMDVPNVNTALRAGKCPVGGVWTNYPYGDLNETCTPVMQSDDVGVRLVTCFATIPSNMEDPQKAEAIKTWMNLYFDAVEWMYSSEENLNQAIDWFMEWNKECGITSDRKEIEAHCRYQRCYTLKDNYELMNTKSENGDYSLAVDYNYEPLKFFVQQGNYTEEDLTTFLEPQYFNSAFVNELYEKQK